MRIVNFYSQAGCPKRIPVPGEASILVNDTDHGIYRNVKSGKGVDCTVRSQGAKRNWTFQFSK